MSEMASWYYVGSFGQLGPLTKDQLDELIEGNVIEKNTFVWRPGMSDWLPAGNVQELDAFFRKMEPFQSPPPFSNPPISTQLAGQPSPPPTSQSLSPFSQPPVARTMPATFGHNMPYGIRKSDKSRTVSGVLQLLIPGAGRIYLGYAALGVLQLVLTISTCGILHVWSIIDGILLLSGQVRIDGYGRALED